MNQAQITDPNTAKNFILAGNATVTLRSVKTGKHLTFRARKSRDVEGLWFVAAMTGSDNESSFTYLGTISGEEYRHGKKSTISKEAPTAAAFTWFFKRLIAGEIPKTLEVWHEGKCGKCGRKLTVPSSVTSGIGPECSKNRLPRTGYKINHYNSFTASMCS